MEAKVSISGYSLTEGQSLTLRVAVTSFLMFVHDEEFGEKLGSPLRENYIARSNEIMELIMKTAR